MCEVYLFIVCGFLKHSFTHVHMIMLKCAFVTFSHGFNLSLLSVDEKKNLLAVTEKILKQHFQIQCVSLLFVNTNKNHIQLFLIQKKFLFCCSNVKIDNAKHLNCIIVLCINNEHFASSRFFP